MRRSRKVALAAAVPLIVAACGSDGDDNAADATPATDAPATTAAATTAAPTTSATEAPAAAEEPAEEMAPVTFTVRVENVSGWSDIRRNVVFNTPTDGDAPGPLMPGGTYQAVIAASPGEKLSFATMFVQSNDWFVAPGPEGIELFDAEGAPISGDVTDQLLLLDSGTEIDQTPGDGADQAPRQAGPDAGDDDPDATVRVVEDRDADAYVAVDVTPLDGGMFMVTIENVSATAALATPFAPGVAVTHVGPNPLYVLGEADQGQGLEALAEDGDPSGLAEYLSTQISLPTPIAPVAAVVHQGDNPIFVGGTNTKADGLETLAEDGGPGDLVAAIGGTAAAVPERATDPGPIMPGGAYEFTIEGSDGDRLSLAAMFVQSNDWFLSVAELDLYADGAPIDGDFSDLVSIWDAGTEADQVPGVGADQAPRQAGPNTGDVDPDDTVRLIGTGAGVVGDNIVTITITAN